MANKKSTGQVFTPQYLVASMLNLTSYEGESVLCRHVMDNSCGQGAFLCEVVRRYIEAYMATSTDVSQLREELETYIHGIEIDGEAWERCLSNLSKIATEAGIPDVQWDVINGDALKETRFDGAMDYVVGNPPYVRVHNLEGQYEAVKQFSFAEGGMTDLYLVFFELGFRMLRAGGRLCYITPSSWLNSVAGAHLRRYIQQNKNLKKLVDLEHGQPFEATTYTAIALFEKDCKSDDFLYGTYDVELRLAKWVECLSFEEAFIGGNLYLGSRKQLSRLRIITEGKYHPYTQVKNGFATLNDKVFIRSSFPFQSLLIDVVKASTGEWRKAIFPYAPDGRPFPIDRIKKHEALWQYLQDNRQLLEKSVGKQDGAWYLYGRSQALSDVAKTKYAINTIVKDERSIKINKVEAGAGVYSGLYILTSLREHVLRKLLISEQFLSYVRLQKKYKSGGYYTFNSRELQQYLNFQISEIIKTKEYGDQFEIFESHRGLF